MEKECPDEENLLLYTSPSYTPQKEQYDNTTAEKIRNEKKLQRKKIRLRKIRLFKVKLFNMLERPRTKFGVLYHSSVFTLVLASLTLSVLITIEKYALDPVVGYALYHLEISLVIIFSIEYCCRLWSCSVHVHYKGLWGRLRFIRKPYMVIDIIVIAAAVLVPAALGTGSELYNGSLFRFLHFLQVLRILRLDRQSGAFKMVSHVVFEHRHELMTCLYLSFILLVGCAFLVYLAEKSDPTESSNKIKNLGDGMYFGMITLLTVGYGDFSPNNWVAKIVIVVFAFIGTAFFALPAGILGSGFALQVAQNKKQKHFNRRLFPAAMVIQYAWRCYSSENSNTFKNVWNKYKVVQNDKQPTSTQQSYFVRNVPQVTLSLDSRKSAVFHRKKRQVSERNFLYNSAVHRNAVGSPIVAAMPERYHSEGNLSFKSSSNIDKNQATIISLPPSIKTEFTDFPQLKRRQSISGVFPTHQNLVSRPLNCTEKNAVRFLLKMKFKTALRKFKVVRRPYDIKDVIEQYTAGQIEMFGFIRKFQTRVESALGIKGEKYAISSLDVRLTGVERKVDSINIKVDSIIDLLNAKGFHSKKTSLCVPLSEATCIVEKLPELTEKSFEQEALDSVFPDDVQVLNKNVVDGGIERLRSDSRFVITPSVFPDSKKMDDGDVFCKNKVVDWLSSHSLVDEEEGKLSVTSVKRTESLQYHMRSTEIQPEFIHEPDAYELEPINQLRNTASEPSLTIGEHAFSTPHLNKLFVTEGDLPGSVHDDSKYLI